MKAQSILDAIVSDDIFMEDYDVMEAYWMYNDEIAECDMLLSDAIRLFISDEPMRLAINAGRLYVLGEGDTIPIDERAEDYRIVGKLKSKVDSYFDGLDSDYNWPGRLASNSSAVQVQLSRKVPPFFKPARTS